MERRLTGSRPTARVTRPARIQPATTTHATGSEEDAGLVAALREQDRAEDEEAEAVPLSGTRR